MCERPHPATSRLELRRGHSAWPSLTAWDALGAMKAETDNFDSDKGKDNQHVGYVE